MPFETLILVCSLALSHGECTPITARASIEGPKVQNIVMCGFLGQTTIASTAAEVRPDPATEYVMIWCPRK